MSDFYTSRTGMASLLTNTRWTTPTNSTRVALPPSNILSETPSQKATFSQLLKSIADMDRLVSLPSWRNFINRERALELTRVLRNYGGYSGILWRWTSGDANPTLDYLIRSNYPYYPYNYSNQGFFHGVIIPGTNIGLDVPHFNASLSKYLDNDGSRNNIPADWAGWAGDMFSLANKLDSLHRHSNIGIDSLCNLAITSLGSSNTWFANPFGKEDFYADIDARNLSTLISSGLSYHDAMDNYYYNNLYGRFGHFVNTYGGWKNFEKKVKSFNFFPQTPYVNPIFVEATKRAFINKIREGCLNEMDCYIP